VDKEVYCILVCGGRNYDDREKLFEMLEQSLQAVTLAGRSFTLVHGGAAGADSLSDEWATVRKICNEGGVVKVYKADWQTHGRAAGPIRNIKMLTESKPDLIIAFKGGRGTAHMMQIGKAAGVPILEVN
jgi:hypothetical protein